jgi:CHAT domain-containing protein/tetratricopeptide (TPR) repeat protein
LLDVGRYSEAQSAAEEFLGSALPKDARAQAAALDLLVESHWRNGVASSDTLRHAEHAIAIHRSLSDARGVAHGLWNLGHVHLLAGRADESVRMLEQSLVEYIQTTGDGLAARAGRLDALGMSLIELGRYDAAKRALSEALNIRSKPPADAPRGTARTLELLSLAAIRAGEYRSARAPLERALALRHAHIDHPDAAGTFAVLGDLLWLEGEPVKARDAYQQCVSIVEKWLRKDHPEVGRCTRRLANALARLGDVTSAANLLERAAQIAERSLGRDHPLFAGYLNDLAEVRRTLMDYSTARRLYEQALVLREQRLGSDHQDLATIILNLALVSSELGDLAEARRQFNRAISIWSKRLGPQHPFVGLAMASLARTVLHHGLVDEALSLQRRVLTIRESTLGAVHPELAEALGDLARTLLAAGRRSEASLVSQRADRIWQRLASPRSPAFATALTLRAEILAAAGDLQGAQQRYSHALEITEHVLGRDHPQSADLRITLGALASHAQPAFAFEQALVAEQATRNFLRSTVRYLPEREALAYASKRPSGLNLILSLVAGPLRSNTESLTQAADAVIKSRGLVLEEVASRLLLLRTDKGDEFAPVWASWLSARQRLANLAVRGEGERTVSGYRELLDETRREAEKAERALAEKSVTFRRAMKPETGLADVRRALPPESALVSFVRFTPAVHAPARDVGASYIAIIISASSAQPAVVPLGSASIIEADIAEWRRRVAAPPSEPRSLLVEEQLLRMAGHRIRKTVWDPIQVHLKGVKRVFVVPDGALHVMNLSSLPLDAVNYLIDGPVLIHYLTAERDIVHLQQPATVARGLLAVGAPLFSTAEAATSSKATFTSRTEDTRSSCGSYQSLRFTPLPATLQEVRDVVRLWNLGGKLPEPAHLLTGKHATEHAFKTRAPGFRILHVATHGFFLGSGCSVTNAQTRAVSGVTTASEGWNTQSPLLQGGLAFADVNDRVQSSGDQEDGVLTAEEVAGLDLDGVEWAVLSACDTGLGAITTGEGVLGLRRAFRIAGARTVIMSLWSVEDRATREWMRSLYEARFRDQEDTSEAMRAASRNVLRNRRSNQMSTHPFFWAAFVAAGDWR